MIENKWKDTPMPEFLRTSLEEFLAAVDDPAKQRLSKQETVLLFLL